MKGFTLIELLVVVLIIGILSAVALPQYQVVVAKTRVASYLPFLRTLQKVQEQYYMANGTYVTSIRDLDIECQSYGSGAHENWCYLDKKGRSHILMSDGAFVLETSGVKASIYFFYRGSASCYAVADNNLATRVCQSLTGDTNPKGFDNTKVYRFQNIS